MQICGNRVVLEPEFEKEYALPLAGLFDELLACDLDTGVCRIIFHREERFRLAENQTMEEFQAFARSHIHPGECGQFQSFFRVGHMKELCEAGRADRMIFRQRISQGRYAWVEAVAVPAGQKSTTILCYVHDIGREEQERYMMKEIAERYVYRDCDYLLCLDADNDSYDILMANGSQAVRPQQGSGSYSREQMQQGSGSYSRELEACVMRDVTSGDREMLLEKASMDHVLSVLDSEGELTIAYGAEGPDGVYMRKQLKFMYYDKPGRKILLMRRDISGEYMEQCRQQERLDDALLHANMDSLTGLYNRQAVSVRINRILKKPMAPASILLFMDLDNFKTVNDTLGHRCGDKVLCCAAQCFCQTLRSSDIIGRVGGDEFVAFLSGIPSLEEAAECTGRLCQSVAKLPGMELKGLKLSCSIGGAVYPRDGRDYETLLQKADVAVYEAKRRGKNQIAFYAPGMEPHPQS